MNRSFVIRELVISPLLRLDHRPAAVLAAVGADDVRGDGRAALRASVELLGGESVVRPPHAGARIGLFALRYGHGSNPNYRADLLNGLNWLAVRTHQHKRSGFGPSRPRFLAAGRRNGPFDRPL